MLHRFSADSTAIWAASITEAERSGDRQLNSDHLLLGVLHDPSSRASAALGIDLATAREARTTLDRQALAAVGIEVSDLDELLSELQAKDGEHLRPGRRRLGRPRIRFSPAAADALRRMVREAEAGDSPSRTLEPEHLLLGLIAGQRPDPAAELLAALGVDTDAVRVRLADAA